MKAADFGPMAGTLLAGGDSNKVIILLPGYG